MIKNKKQRAAEQEWNIVKRREQRFLQKRQESKTVFINEKLEGKVPPKLEETLRKAFAKAFFLVFEKGNAVIEKTYNKEELEQMHKVRDYAVQICQNKKSFRAISNKAAQTGGFNLLLSGVSGLGLGFLGVGLPDIPLFTGMILKSVYELALNYGYEYETNMERIFILKLIQGAVSYGTQLEDINREINYFLDNNRYQVSPVLEEEIQKTADLLAREMLYLKFLQTIPVVGAVGGAYDAIYMNKVVEYAALKYRQRYLASQMMETIGTV